MSLVKITATVALYRAKPSIVGCLDALAAQTRPPDEILVVDDGSDDGGGGLAETWLRRASAVPLRLVSHDGHRGQVQARNTALNEAKGDWVAGVDADVLVSADWLERLERELAQDPGLSGLGGRVLEAHRTAPADAWRSLHLAQHWGEVPIEDPDFLYGSGTLYCREHLLAAGGYDASTDGPSADVDLGRKLYAGGRRLRYAPQALAYRQRKDSPLTVSEEAWRWMKIRPEQAGVYRLASRYIQYLTYEGQNVVKHLSMDRKAGSPWPVLRLSLSLLPFLMLRDLVLLEKNGAMDPAVVRESGLGLAALTRTVWVKIGLKNQPGPEFWPEQDRHAPKLLGGFDEAGFEELRGLLPKGDTELWKHFIKAWTECLNVALQAHPKAAGAGNPA